MPLGEVGVPWGLPSLLAVLKFTVKILWSWSMPRAASRPTDASMLVAGLVLSPSWGGGGQEKAGLGLPFRGTLP